jgi:hypothetical protein
MSDEAHEREGGRAAAKRALRNAASPLVGYFDRRFQDVHDHVERLPFDRLEAILHQELKDARAEVAADTDTIAELSFTLERFADLFTARMEQLAGQFARVQRTGTSEHDAMAVELPFAFAAAADLERGATVATIGDSDGSLSIGLAALGLQVTAVDPGGSAAHPDVAIVDERVDDWIGPAQPLEAVFALSSTNPPPGSDRLQARDTLAAFQKWIRPTGLLVIAFPLDDVGGTRAGNLEELLADWDVEWEAHFEQDQKGAWRRVDERPARGVAVLRATHAPEPPTA